MNFSKAHIIQKNSFSIGQAEEQYILQEFSIIRQKVEPYVLTQGHNSAADRGILLEVLIRLLNQIRQEMKEELESTLINVYKEAFLEACADEVEEGRSIIMDLALGYDKHWCGAAAIERVDANINAIISDLQGLILGWRGDNPVVLMGLIWDMLQKAQNEYKRLIRTECEASFSMGLRDAELCAGYLYAIVENDDPCDEICAEMVGEQPVGLNGELGLDLPPYHPNCKCVFTGYEIIY